MLMVRKRGGKSSGSIVLNNMIVFISRIQDKSRGERITTYPIHCSSSKVVGCE